MSKDSQFTNSEEYRDWLHRRSREGLVGKDIEVIALRQRLEDMAAGVELDMLESVISAQLGCEWSLVNEYVGNCEFHDKDGEWQCDWQAAAEWLHEQGVRA